MKRFLTKVVFTCMAFTGLYVITLFAFARFAPSQLKKNFLYERHSGGHLYSRFKDADTTKNVDVLVLGSSHAYRGFDPRIFEKNNIDLFVLGSSAQSPIQTEYLLDKYIDRLNPKVVLYEVYYVTLGLDGAESAIDVISNTSDFNEELFNMTFKINNVMAYNTLAYAGLVDALGATDTTESVKKGLDTYIEGGYIERKMIENEYKAEKSDSLKIHINEKQLEAFKSICNKLKEKNIETILVQAPIPHDRYEMITNRKELDNIFKSIKTAEYYNFNETASFNNNLFYDFSHLNQKGVERFDAMLIDTLKSRSDISKKLSLKTTLNKEKTVKVLKN